METLHGASSCEVYHRFNRKCNRFYKKISAIFCKKQPTEDKFADSDRKYHDTSGNQDRLQEMCHLMF